MNPNFAGTGSANTASANAGMANTNLAGTSLADAGIESAGIADAGIANTSIADTSIADTSFAALHRPGEPLLLPNAWDYASAKVLTEMGYRAIGTTSYGVAFAHGLPDAAGATREETAALACRLRSLPGYLTVDIEGGFSDDPDEVAEFVNTLNVDGINIEDGINHTGVLSRKVEAIKARAPDIFVNARTDTYWLKERQHETRRRLEAYLDAGADGVFVPGLQDPALIRELVALGSPVNILLQRNGLTVPHLADLGVARISTGSLLFRIALGTLRSWQWDVTPAGEEAFGAGW